MWATTAHLAAIRKAGLAFDNAVDVGAESFAEEKKHGYSASPSLQTAMFSHLHGVVKKITRNTQWTRLGRSRTGPSIAAMNACRRAWQVRLIIAMIIGIEQNAIEISFITRKFMCACISIALAAEGGCAYPLDLTSIGQSVEGR
eukprot:SAG11_NODE_9503_length_906_cov_1.033457_1_plen_143_part_10